MDETTRAGLDMMFDTWTMSGDGTRVAGLKRGENRAIIVDATTLQQIASIAGEFERLAWISGDTRIMAIGHHVMTVYDSMTGTRLFHVEGMFP